jgi:hypothetical protein
MRPLGREYKAQQKNIDVIQAALEKLKAASTAKPAGAVAADVELALRMYDELKGVVANPEARADLAAILEKVHLRMWLSFVPVKKGKRTLRKLKGGIVTTGDANPPVPPYGLDGNGLCDGHCGNGMSPMPAGNETPSVNLQRAFR